MAEISNRATSEFIELGSYVSADAILKRVAEAEELISKKLRDTEEQLAFLGGQEEALKRTASAVFPDGERLTELRKRSMQIAIELGLLKDQAGTSALAEGAQQKSTSAAGLVEDVDGPPDQTPEDDEAELERLLDYA
jgi:hypothetical protein